MEGNNNAHEPDEIEEGERPNYFVFKDDKNIFESNVILGTMIDISHLKLHEQHVLFLYVDQEEFMQEVISSKVRTTSPLRSKMKLSKGTGNPDSFLGLAAFNSETKVLKKVATKNAPQAFTFYDTALLGTNILVFGGEKNGELCSNCYSLDLRTLDWQKKEFENEKNASNFLKRKHYSLSALSNYAICFGGIVDNMNNDDKVSKEMFIISLEYIFPMELTAENNENLPVKLFCHKSVVLGGCLFIFGGFTSVKDEKNNALETPGKRQLRSSATSNLYSIDLNTRVSRLVTCNGTIPEPRGFHSMTIINEDSFLIHGGVSTYISNLTSQTQGYSDFMLFSVASSSWFMINVATPPRFMGSILANEDENIYLFGGISSVSDLPLCNKLKLNTEKENESCDEDLRSLWFFKFKEDPESLSQNYLFDYESPTFDKVDFLMNANLITSTLQSNLEEIENSAHALKAKIEQITGDIIEIKRECSKPKVVDFPTNLEKESDDFKSIISQKEQQIANLLSTKKSSIEFSENADSRVKQLYKAFHQINSSK